MSFRSITAKVPKSWFLLFGIWLTLLLSLVGWWGYFATTQAKMIYELEIKAGVAQTIALANWKHTSRMLFWESFTFFLLILITSLVIVVILIRDRKRSRSLRAFFASFTHEIKTPLTGIRLQAEALEESFLRLFQSGANNSSTPLEFSLGNSQDKMMAENHLRRLLQDVLRLESQVETTLELSRLEGGGSVFPRNINFNRWLHSFLRPYEEHFSQQALFTPVFQSANPSDPFHLVADPTALQIVFRNLVENSIRHSGKHPVSIRIETSLSETPLSLEKSLTEPTTALHIQYSDSGTRLEKTIEKQLGTLFFKGPQSQGAGVGLYLLKMLTQKMGGRIQYSVSTTGGLICDLWLPTAEAGGVRPGLEKRVDSETHQNRGAL